MVAALNDGEKCVYYASKKGFKEFICKRFDVELFREPDEAYIIHHRNDDIYIIKILEKKNQNTAGSVEEKLLTGQAVRELYEMCFEEHKNVVIEFAFCVSNYLKNNLTSSKKKYIMFSRMFEKHNIPVFFGEDLDYHTKLDSWIGL